jgi:hypothetical protein
MPKKYILPILLLMIGCKTESRRQYYTQADTFVLGENMYEKSRIKDTTIFILGSDLLMPLGKIKLRINNEVLYHKKLPLLVLNEYYSVKDSVVYVNKSRNSDCWIEIYIEDKHIYMEQKISLKSAKVVLKFTHYSAKLPENIYRFLVLYTD